MSLLRAKNSNTSLSTIVECIIASFITTPISEYSDSIRPLYTIVGYKNTTMQKATANAVNAMNLSHKSMTLVDGCCATGSLFFGLKTYPWQSVVLNDLNPLRTNFLNVLKNEPLKLIKQIWAADLSFIKQPEKKKQIISAYKYEISNYEKNRANYKHVDCNVEIAYNMFIIQCIDKAMIEGSDKILKRVLRFLPAHLKLRNAKITQEDCLKYLKNDNIHKLVLLDVPYIGSEYTCAIRGYNYKPFHEKVAECLQNAGYPFLYYCRSTPPKSDNAFTKEQGEHIMKMKLAQHFMDKCFYFQKVHLTEDTELMISNQLYYEETQFQWTEFEENIT